jgi:hypothetical protein
MGRQQHVSGHVPWISPQTHHTRAHEQTYGTQHSSIAPKIQRMDLNKNLLSYCKLSVIIIFLLLFGDVGGSGKGGGEVGSTILPD